MHCLNCKKDVEGKKLFCDDACRMAYRRRTKKGEQPEHLDPEHTTRTTRTGLTRTDSLFDLKKPNYYVFGDVRHARVCITCNKKFTTHMELLKFCSPGCEQRAFDDFNSELKQKGFPQMVKGSDLPGLAFVSSGIAEIDALSGGFPRGRVTEVFGLKGVGKTSLMTRIINALPSLRIFYLDSENAISDAPDNVDLIVEQVLERASDLVEQALHKHYDLVVIDSVASLVPRAEIEGDSGDAHMGLKARLMSQWMRRINTHLANSNAAMVFINQQREAMNPYGPSKFTPGGLALGYAASLRLELKSNKADRFEGGHYVHVEIEKSRVCKPYQKAKFKLIYEEKTDAKS